MKIGVFVGSFDPIHNGHREVIRHLIKNKYVDKVIIVPTNSYWDKDINTSLEDRINMININKDKNTIVGDKYSNYKCTYQILEEIKNDYNAELYLIIGADNIIKFHLWKNIDQILENKILVLGRNNINVSNYINSLNKTENFIFVKDFKEKNISSTFIRKRLKEKDYESLKGYLDCDIIDYILSKDIYGGIA